MQVILVAGGAGFIGSYISEKLLKEGYTIVCVDNFISGSKANVNHLTENPNFKLLQHDLTQPLKEELLPSQIDYIFHLASPASPSQKSKRSYMNHPIETLLVNSLGTYHLLELAKKHVARFLFSSSSEIYGDPAVSPQSEAYNGNVNPNGIRSVYDEAKRFGEAMTMAYFRKYDLDVRIIRIFNTYGPRMMQDDGRMISNFITQAIAQKPITVYGDGTQTRSFCFISDMIEGLKLAMFSDTVKGEVMNMGNPDERTIKELAELVKRLSGTTSEIVFEELPKDDPKKRNPDITKASELLGWKPTVGLDQGLQQTIAYFRSL